MLIVSFIFYLCRKFIAMFHKLKLRIDYWRYTRLFSRLYWHFLHEGMRAGEAAQNADEAFEWLTGYPHYGKWYKQVQSELASSSSLNNSNTLHQETEEETNKK